jgi:transketolase
MSLKHLKENIIRTATATSEGHIPAAFSILDLLWVLYDRVIDVTPGKMADLDRDRFILSKGHASIGLYAVLAEKGFFNWDELKNFGKFGSIFGGHPDRTKVPGVEASTGSLGHGFPMAVGLALGAKIRVHLESGPAASREGFSGERRDIPTTDASASRGGNLGSEPKITPRAADSAPSAAFERNPAKKMSKVYVIVGDGECNEGTIWESAMLGAHHKLDNLYCIVDQNHSGDGPMDPHDLREKFESFGWQAVRINGHDHEEIYKALTQKSVGKPIAIIAETVKGNGAKIMENSAEWTHKYPTPEQMEIIIKELV